MSRPPSGPQSVPPAPITCAAFARGVRPQASAPVPSRTCRTRAASLVPPPPSMFPMRHHPVGRLPTDS
eukprot:147626-Rhodomonas_salina.1